VQMSHFTARSGFLFFHLQKLPKTNMIIIRSHMVFFLSLLIQIYKLFDSLWIFPTKPRNIIISYTLYMASAWPNSEALIKPF
jgi:hypothetical protein